MVKGYCDGALEFLERAYDPDRALFSYSTRLAEGDRLANDFAHPQTLRYTVNSFLGVHEAVRHGATPAWLPDVEAAVERFLAGYYDMLEHADLGLLLVLLASLDPQHRTVDPSLARITEAIERVDAATRFNMQDLSWMLWGTIAIGTGRRTDALAHRIHALMRARFVHAESRLPRHSVSRYRRNIVSFGSLVYYLRATWAYAERYDDAAARDLFVHGVRTALGFQGPDGEWPWMIDVRTGVPIDLYPVFTVHQDSMAMLFLFPAESAGVPGVEAAIERSFRWNTGQNELGTSLVRTEPCFFVYRSIERDDRLPRLRRYVRALGGRATSPPARSEHVRINRECRSYHLGWVLYAWSSASRIDDTLHPVHANEKG